MYSALRSELFTAESLILEALEARRLYEQFQCTEPSLLSYEQVRDAIICQPPLSVRSRELTPSKRRNRFSRPAEQNQTLTKFSPQTPLPKTKSPLMKELLDIDKELDFDIRPRSKSVISDPKNTDCYEVYLKSILLKVTKVTKERDRVEKRKRTATDYWFIIRISMIRGWPSWERRSPRIRRSWLRLRSQRNWSLKKRLKSRRRGTERIIRNIWKKEAKTRKKIQGVHLQEGTPWGQGPIGSDNRSRFTKIIFS